MIKISDSHSVLCGLTGLLSLGVPPHVQAQFSVNPVIVQIPASGADAVQLMVRNEGENALQFRVYALDFDVSETGEHSYWEPGTRPESCGERIQIAPDAFSVPSGRIGTVDISLSPGPTDRTCWSMVLVETSGSIEGSIQVNQRIGVKVYGLSGEWDVSGEVLEGSVTNNEDQLHVAFTVRNDGAWPLRPDGIVEIRDVQGTLVASTPIDAFSVLPDRMRAVEVTVSNADLQPGRYLAVPILDFGVDYLSGTQIDFRIEE